MIYVTLAEAALVAVCLATFGRLLAAQARDHARRQDLLINQLLHATGRTWTPPPADSPAVEPTPREWTAAPDQDDLLYQQVTGGYDVN